MCIIEYSEFFVILFLCGLMHLTVQMIIVCFFFFKQKTAYEI